MDICENAEHCNFFNRKQGISPSLSQYFKQTYCQENFKHCARHMLREKMVGGYYLPEEDPSAAKLEVLMGNMFPHDREQALKVMEHLVN